MGPESILIVKGGTVFMKKRILCFGDSNTWGAIPTEPGRYADDVRWTGVLQRELGDDYQVIEEGHNGRTTVFDDVIEGRLSGVKYFYPCVDSQSPLDLVIIMLGTNDLKPRFGVEARSIANALKNYLNVLKVVPMAGNPPKVLLAAPILVDPAYREEPFMHGIFGEDADERSKGFAEAYEEMAKEEGIAFINAAQYAKASKRDGIHMEAEEHAKLGKAFAEKVKEILG